jgi:hypothetical protein
MVGEFVFMPTDVLCFTSNVFNVGERKSLRILFICIGTAVHV